MTPTTNLTASSDRTPVLARTGRAARPTNSAMTRLGGTARKLLDALMRSLAAPHV